MAKKAPRFDARDFALIAEYVSDEYGRRKRLREASLLDKHMAEIDRQVAMKPDTSYKLDSTGQEDKNKSWLPEVEPELQSQTLEVSMADARRLLFPADNQPWFRAHGAMTDSYMRHIDLQSLILGDENDIPSRIDQDSIDQLIAGTINHWHRQYQFRDHIDLINAEAFKYSVGIGRMRSVRKKVIMDTSKGFVADDQVIPVLVPRSIKQTYLDDRQTSLMNEGFDIGPGTIFLSEIKYEDLKAAANLGSNDPNRDDGGWMPRYVRLVKPDKNQSVKLLEWEGDLVVPRKTTDSIVLERPVVTIAIGSGQPQVVRYRFSQLPFTSYISFYYQREHIDTPYGSSPLLKGRGLQALAQSALFNFLCLAALTADPPKSWNPDDPYFKSTGGPRWFPGASWETQDGVKLAEVGEPGAMLSAYMQARHAYYGVTGVNPPRLGAQTVSHTTAFAKQAELARGENRIVDYTNSVMEGPLNKYLQGCMMIGRKNLKNAVLYIDAYNGFVKISGRDLPEYVVFDVFGAGGPQEKQARNQAKLQAIQLADSLDQLRAQYQKLGVQPILDLEKVIYEVLGLGGWTDIDALLNRAAKFGGTGVPGESQGGSGVPPAGQSASAAPAAALEAAATAIGS